MMTWLLTKTAGFKFPLVVHLGKRCAIQFYVVKVDVTTKSSCWITATVVNGS